MGLLLQGNLLVIRQIAPIRIVICDDFAEMFDAVEKCLAPTCEVVGRVSDGLALVECVCQVKPDILMTDLSMPKLNGVEAVRQLRSLGCQVPAIILTVFDDDDLAEEAFAAGAQGFVLKSRMGTDLEVAVREVLAGKRFKSRTPRKHPTEIIK
jgi:DNA-binding NarL/FixJ family response regulator